HALMPRKLVIAEDESNDPGVVLSRGMDGVWADDFHHVAHVILTGESDGYYASYRGSAERLAETIRKGWLYEGQVYPTTGKPRGQPATALPAEAFVYCLQNHDQIGNRAVGDRMTGGGAKADAKTYAGYAALSTVLLFLPMTPLLFMGQEWAASSPFQFFTDHDEALGRLISAGRRQEFKGFRAFADPAARERIPDPQAEETFTRSKLRWEEREQGSHDRVLRLYKQLVKLRRSDTVLREPARERLEAAAQDGLLIVRRWTAAPAAADGQDRLLLANLTDQPIAAEIVAAHLGTRSLLLRSDLLDERPGSLPSWTAVIAAGVAA
ncbi:MAG: DUF3459 domain-containing protein, partial [Polyangia bacterium]